MNYAEFLDYLGKRDLDISQYVQYVEAPVVTITPDEEALLPADYRGAIVAFHITDQLPRSARPSATIRPGSHWFVSKVYRGQGTTFEKFWATRRINDGKTLFSSQEEVLDARASVERMYHSLRLELLGGWVKKKQEARAALAALHERRKARA